MEALIKGEPMEYDDNSFSELSSQLAATHQSSQYHAAHQQPSAFIDAQAEQFYLNNIQNVLNGKCDDDYEFLIDLIKMNKTTPNANTTPPTTTTAANLDDFNDDDDDDDQFTDELINPKYLRQTEKPVHNTHKALSSSSSDSSVFSSHTAPASSSVNVNPDLMSTEFFFPNESENECFSNFSANPELSGQDLDLFSADLSSLANRPLSTADILLDKPAKPADFIQFNNLNLTESLADKELHSRLWFSCRREFEAVSVGGVASSDDIGWGALLRCAQMLIGQGLIVHFFRAEWTLYKKFRLNEYNLYKEIISLFNDRCALSLF